MTNCSSAAASSAMMAAVVASNSARIEAENRQRRMRNKGNDECYFIVGENIDSVGNKIAKIYDNWYYKDKKINAENPTYNWHAFFVALVLCAFFSVIGLMVYPLIVNDFDTMFPLNRVFIASIISLMISICIGYFSGGDEEVTTIELEAMTRSKTSVLIHVYDDSGYRNYHENEIHKILALFKE